MSWPFRNPWKPDPPCPSGFLPYGLVRGRVLCVGSRQWPTSQGDSLLSQPPRKSAVESTSHKICPQLFTQVWKVTVYSLEGCFEDEVIENVNWCLVQSEYSNKYQLEARKQFCLSYHLARASPLPLDVGYLLKVAPAPFSRSFSWEYQTTWPASWEICMRVKKQQLELDMEQLVPNQERSTSRQYIVTLLI